MKAASQDFTVFEDEIPCCSVSYKPIYKAASVRGIRRLQTAVLLPAGWVLPTTLLARCMDILTLQITELNQFFDQVVTWPWFKLGRFSARAKIHGRASPSHAAQDWNGPPGGPDQQHSLALSDPIVLIPGKLAVAGIQPMLPSPIHVGLGRFHGRGTFFFPSIFTKMPSRLENFWPFSQDYFSFL